MKMIAVLFLFLSHFASAAIPFTKDFAVDGYYWEKFPIEMSVDEGGKNGERLLSIVQYAVDSWHEALAKVGLGGIEIFRIVPDSPNRIYFADIGVESRKNNVAADENLAGLTIRKVMGGAHYSTVQIVLNKYKYKLNNTDISRETYNEMISSVLTTVVLHELGHVICLDHTKEGSHNHYSGEGVSIMSEFLSAGMGRVESIDAMAAADVIDETMARQESGYSRALASEAKSSCGTVDFSGENGSGPGNFLFSFLLGVGTLFLLRRRKKISL